MSKTLEGVLKLDFDTVIPGHGPVSTKADLVKFKSDLETMRGRLVGPIRGRHEGAARENSRGRLRLEVDRVSAEPADTLAVCNISRSMRSIAELGR